MQHTHLVKTEHRETIKAAWSVRRQWNNKWKRMKTNTQEKCLLQGIEVMLSTASWSAGAMLVTMGNWSKNRVRGHTTVQLWTPKTCYWSQRAQGFTSEQHHLWGLLFTGGVSIIYLNGASRWTSELILIMCKRESRWGLVLWNKTLLVLLHMEQALYAIWHPVATVKCSLCINLMSQAQS